MTTDAPTLRTVLSDYDVGAPLGEGQFGKVWAARHRQLTRDVAVKELTAAAGGVRFRREARILAHLDHRHVVRVYDYREAGDLRLLIMERLTGGTVADRLSVGMSQESVLMATLAAASALHHLHLQGVLHRDVKPANLMFDGNGVLKVTDFGTARGQQVVPEVRSGALSDVPYLPADPFVPDVAAVLATIDEPGVEQSFAGQFLGTPGYAAPEQGACAFGVPGAVIGPAADQYSLAAVAYQALSGCYTHRIDGGPTSLLARRVTEDARPLREANPAVPASVADVVMTGLARQPELRYASVEQFALALAAAGAAAWGPSWAAGARVDAGSAGPAGAAAGTGPGAASRPGAGIAIVEPGPIRDAVLAPVLPPRRRRRRGRFIAAAAAAVLVLGGGTASVLLSRGAPPTVAAGPAVGLATVWEFGTGGDIFASPALAGDLVVVGSADGSVYGVDAERGTRRWVVPTNGAVRSSAAVDGGLVYVGSDDGLLRALWRGTGQEHWSANLGATIVSSPAVAAGLVVVGADKLYAVDAATGDIRWEFETSDVVVSSPAIATRPTGTGDAAIATAGASSSAAAGPDAGADEQVVVVGSRDGRVYGVDLATGEQRWAVQAGEPVLASPTVAGGLAYLGDGAGAFRALRIEDGSPAWTADAGAAVNSSAVVVGDRVMVGTSGGTVHAFGVTDGVPDWTYSALGRFDSTPAAPEWGLVVAGTDGIVRVLDVDTGEPIAWIETDGPVLSSPRVSGNAIFVGSYDDRLYRLDFVG